MIRGESARVLQVIAALAAAVLFLTGCDPGTGSVEGEASTRTKGSSVDEPLRAATPWEITSLDPVAEGYWSMDLGYGEYLLRPTPSGVPEPWVLESFEATSDTEWQLELHEGVTFQNGKPCDAAAVAAMMNRQLAKNPLLEPVLPDAVAEAIGPTTVKLTTASPVSYVPELLANAEMFPVYDVEAVKAAGKDTQALVGAGIYTGPYEVTELNSEQIVLERNENYWQGRPPLPGVEVKFIPDHQARVLAVQSGEIDIAFYPPPQAATMLESSAGAHYVESAESTLGPRAYPNLRKPPMDDVRVRRAVTLAIDYEEIANDVMDGHFEVPQGMYPMEAPFAVANQVHDPDQARALLDEAGWVDSGERVRTKNGQQLELKLVTYREGAEMEPIAVAMRSQLREVGITLQIEPVEDISLTYSRSGEFTDWHLAMSGSGYFGIYGDYVGKIGDYFTSDGARNASINDPEIDALHAELTKTFDEDRRYEILRELQDIIVAEQAYGIIVSGARRAAVVSDDWACYEPSAMLIQIDYQTAPC
jgi:peptide/nickel transport system substrate-binding protein